MMNPQYVLLSDEHFKIGHAKFFGARQRHYIIINYMYVELKHSQSCYSIQIFSRDVEASFITHRGRDNQV